jgi:hypothetical protein
MRKVILLGHFCACAAERVLVEGGCGVVEGGSEGDGVEGGRHVVSSKVRILVCCCDVSCCVMI